MRGINSKLTQVVNFTDTRGQQIRQLIHNNLGVNCRYPFTPIGDDPSVRFPVVYVQPLGQLPDLETTGKYHLHISYAILWYVLDNVAADATAISTAIMENILKLFSNNANNDLLTGNPATLAYRANEPFWTDSNFTNRFRTRPPLKMSLQGHGEQYMVFGGGVLEIDIWTIK